MAGAMFALVLLGALGEFKTLQQVVVFVDEQTLALLFGMMVRERKVERGGERDGGGEAVGSAM